MTFCFCKREGGYDNEKERVAGELDQKGRAEIADVLEIATFPTAFKHPDVRIDQ